MYKTDYDNEPCGVKLVRLINTRALDIAKREFKNEDKMCLYGTGEYWTGFERSAYFLAQLFPGLEPFVINHVAYPFSIVGVSVSAEDFRKYMREHIACKRQENYLEYTVEPIIPEEYGHWHTSKVK